MAKNRLTFFCSTAHNSFDLLLYWWAFDWSAAENAAKAGGYAGALGTFATAIAVSVAKPLLTKLAQKLAKSTNIGNTRFGKFIKSNKFQAFLGESTDDVVGKGYSGGSPADPYDLGMNWGKNAAGWKRYSMNGVTSELRWYKAGVIFKIATNDAMRVMAFFDNDGPWTNIRYIGGFASKNWAYHGFNEGWLRGFMDSMGVGQATYYAPEAYGNDMCTYGSCSSNSGGDFGLEYIETGAWGGLSLTFIVSAFALILCFPIGMFLALGRRSNLPAIRYSSIGFIKVSIYAIIR